jgi:hypothetical protein
MNAVKVIQTLTVVQKEKEAYYKKKSKGTKSEEIRIGEKKQKLKKLKFKQARNNNGRN